MSLLPRRSGGISVQRRFTVRPVIVRVVLRPHREPASRIAWIVVIVTLPVAGILAYILFGEVNIGSRRIARMKKVLESLPPIAAAVAGDLRGPGR